MVARDHGWQRHPAAIKAAASGNFNPVGYNRVYVYVEGDFTWDKWWDGLRAGRAMVTNGPLIRPGVEGQPPGHVFQADRGQAVELEIGLTISTRDKVSYLESSGTASPSTSAARKWKATGGKLPPVKSARAAGSSFAQSPTNPAHTATHTALYYVEIGSSRISRRAIFVDWCESAPNRLPTNASSRKFADDQREKPKPMARGRLLAKLARAPRA
jgi:hypothetical protein